MGLFSNIIRNAVSDGISEGIRRAAGNAVEKAVTPAAERWADRTADSLDKAAGNAEAENTGNAFANLERAANNYAQQLEKASNEIGYSVSEGGTSIGAPVLEGSFDGIPGVFPAWTCGGTDPEVESGDTTDKNGNPYVFFRCDCEPEDLKRYIAVLENDGFTRDPEYSDKWFKRVSGTKYVFDTTEAFSSGGMCVCFYTD